MDINKLYYASVIDNNHTPQDGRVQIKIIEHHENTETSLLPWARPFSLSTGGGDKQGVSNIPEVGSNVWIFYSDEDDGIYKKPFYIADGSLDNFNPYLLFNSNVKSSIDSSAIYPNAKFYYFKNGICLGVDSTNSNPEIFIYHPKASIFINKSGDISIDTKDGNISAKTTSGDISLDSGSGMIELKNAITNMNARIVSLIDIIKGLQTFGSPAAHTVLPLTQGQLEIEKGLWQQLFKA